MLKVSFKVMVSILMLAELLAAGIIYGVMVGGI